MSETFAAFRFLQPYTHSSVVPTLWVQGFNECYWPNIKSQSRVDLLIDNCTEPFTTDDNWCLYHGRVLESGLTKKSAKERAVNDKWRRFQDTTEDDGTPPKRKKRKVKVPKPLADDEIVSSPENSSLVPYAESPGKLLAATKILNFEPKKGSKSLGEKIKTQLAGNKNAKSVKKSSGKKSVTASNLSPEKLEARSRTEIVDEAVEDTVDIQNDESQPTSSNDVFDAEENLDTTKSNQAHPSTSKIDSNMHKDGKNSQKTTASKCECQCCDHMLFVAPKLRTQAFFPKPRDVKNWSEAEFRMYVVSTLNHMATRDTDSHRRKQQHAESHSSSDFDWDLCAEITSLTDIMNLEKQLGNEEFQRKWISKIMAKTEPFISSDTSLFELGRIILRSIFDKGAQQQMCYSGLAKGKFALQKGNIKSNILKGLEVLFRKRGIKKYARVKRAIQEVIYKCKGNQKSSPKVASPKKPNSKEASPKKSSHSSPKKSSRDSFNGNESSPEKKKTKTPRVVLYSDSDSSC